MEKNTHVIYNGKDYEIIYTCTSGYCEIKERDSLFKVELVPIEELTKALS